MEWILGIGVAGRDLVAPILTGNGCVEQAPLSSLVNRGIPAASNLSRHRIEIDFSHWKPCDPSEYLAAFDITLPRGIINGHSVLQTAINGRRFIMPVLVLMRALFRPSKHMLPTMFGPHAIERTCHLDYSTEVPTIVVDARWATEGIIERNRDWRIPLAWMLCYPSAANMAASIHDEALRGRIGCTLPVGRSRMILHGKRHARTMFVTEATVVTISPADEPVHNTDQCKSVLILHRGIHKLNARPTRLIDGFSVPRRADGSIEMSDYEWSYIEPLLNDDRIRNTPYRLNQRAIFDGILFKLAHGVGWKKVPYKVGDWRNASAGFQRWTKRGVMSKALSQLRETRSMSHADVA